MGMAIDKFIAHGSALLYLMIKVFRVVAHILHHQHVTKYPVVQAVNQASKDAQ